MVKRPTRMSRMGRKAYSEVQRSTRNSERCREANPKVQVQSEVPPKGPGVVGTST